MGNNTIKTIGKNRRSVLTNLGTCVQTHILKYCINTSLWLRRWIEMIFNVLIAIVPVGVDITQRNASCAQYICVFNCSKRNYHYYTSVNLIYRSAARSVTMSLYFTGHMPHGMDGGKYRCMFWHLWCLICFLNRFPLKMLRSEEKTIKCKQVVSYKIADFYHFIMIFKRLFVNILRHLSSLHKLDFTRFCFQIQLIPIQYTWM